MFHAWFVASLVFFLTAGAPRFAQHGPKAKPRLDAHGDPLPKYAITRLGRLVDKGMGVFERAPCREWLTEGALGGVVGEVFFGADGIASTVVRKPTDWWSSCVVTHRWDTTTGKNLGQMVPRRGEVGDPKVVRVQGDLAAVATPGVVTLWDVSAKKPVRVLRASGFFKDVTGLPHFSHDGTKVAATFFHIRGPVYHYVCVWDVTSGDLLHVWGRPGNNYDPTVWSADGATFVAALNTIQPGPLEKNINARLSEFTFRVLFLEMATGKTREIQGADKKRGIWANRIALSPDGRLAAVRCYIRAGRGVQSVLQIYETASGHLLSENPVNNTQDAGFTAFTNDSRTVVDAQGREINVWDAVTGTKRGQFTGHTQPVLCLALAPDGRRLVTGSADHTALVWDLTALPEVSRPGRVLDQSDLQQCWADLADADAGRAYRTMDLLLTAPAQTVPLLKQRVEPVPADVAKRVAKLIDDLDSKQFKVRDQAQNKLSSVGELAAPQLRQKLTELLALELKRRIEKLLAQAESPVPSPEELRCLRAVAVLEYLGTSDAEKALQALAAGAPQARLTREAQVALKRLAVAGR